MTTKEKLLLSATALYLMSGAAAFAEVNVQLDVGAPAYVAPAYVSPYPTNYDPHHRNHDLAYWRDQHRHDDHHDDHDDHGRR